MVKPIAAMFLLLLPACAPGDGREATGASGAIQVARSAAVATPPDTPVSSLDPAAAPQPPAAPTAECPVVATRGWSAAVIGKPPASGDRLRVAGTLTLAQGGYRARLEQGPVLEIHPPIQQLELAFARTGAGGAREVAVQGEFPALAEYGAIEIRCGGRTLATITSVVWTERAIMEGK